MARPVRYGVTPTGRERAWREDELIVSKTDTRGIITYANRVFLRVAALEESDAIGTQHNFLRHPDMPRCVFKLIWDTIESGKEIFGYVKNLAANGDYYWVMAHITPTFDMQGKIIGYHSSRRKPNAEQITKIAPIYKLLLDEEKKHTSPKGGLEASTALLLSYLKEQGMTYEEFVFTL